MRIKTFEQELAESFKDRQFNAKLSDWYFNTWYYLEIFSHFYWFMVTPEEEVAWGSSSM